MKTRIAIITALLTLSGCARFSTTQTDISRKEPNGDVIRTITTRAKAWTLWEANSQLATWKATQTDSSQGAEVGGLNQSSQITTNTSQIVTAIVDAAIKASVKSIVP